MARQYLKLTPRFAELVSTWQMIVGDACKIKKPDQMERFWSHFQQTSKAADRYNDLVAYLRSPAEGWTDEHFKNALKHGRAIQETDRTTVHVEEEA